MMDCGHTVPARLAPLGLTLHDLDAVFLSHLHGDHIYGLEEWGFRSLLQWQIRPRLFIAENLAAPLWNNVLSGTMAGVNGTACALTDYFDVIPLRVDEPLTVGPWTLTIHPVRHVPHVPAFGLKVTADAATVGFTCDTLADADPWFFEETEIVFHDCTFTPHFPQTVHAHFEELKAYPQAFRAKMSLVHYDDMVREKRLDPAWQSELAATEMRLTDPYQPFHF